MLCIAGKYTQEMSNVSRTHVPLPCAIMLLIRDDHGDDHGDDCCSLG